MRSCSRTGCRWPAAASLSFRYASRQVWLLDLRDPDPALYDLCPHHADTLVVPRGWHRVDQRTATPAVREPSAQELVTRAGHRRRPVAEHPVAEQPLAPRSRELIPRAPAPPATRTDRTSSPLPALPPRENRYEGLHRDLPRVAAELAERYDTPLPDARGPQQELKGQASKLSTHRSPQPPGEPGVIVPIDAARRPVHPTPGPPLNG